MSENIYVMPYGTTTNGRQGTNPAGGQTWSTGNISISNKAGDTAVPTITIVFQGLDSWTGQLRNIAERLERIEELLSQFVYINSSQEEIRDIPDDYAKDEIKAYYQKHDGEDIYPDDVANELKLDLIQVIRVCEKLVREGELAERHSGSP